MSPILALILVTAADDPAAGNVARVVDSTFERLANERKFSGVVLVVKDGKPLVTKTFGFADWPKKIPNTPDTGFMIFSVTKQFTAAAILRLQDRGLLKTSDPISKYVANWPKEWNSVAIHHLLSHASGIDVDTLYFWLVKHHPRFWEDPDLPPPKFEAKPLLDEPGKVFRYSNAGYSVLSLVVERLTGKKFAEALQVEVFCPLGMTHTSCEGATPVPGRARGHSLSPISAEIVEQKTHFIVGAGDIVSTAGDLLQWDDALHSGQFLSANARKEMFTPHVPGKRGGMGYGWQIRGAGEEVVQLFGGSGTGFRSLVVRKPCKRIYLALLSNCESPLDAEFAVEFLAKVESAVKSESSGKAGP